MLALLFAATLATEIQAGETLIGPAVALDGDTIFMTGATGEPERVRLFGLDAPEMQAPLGPVARAALDDLIADQEVTCAVVDVDSRGRATFLRELSDAFSDEMKEHEFDIAVALLRGIVIEHKLMVPDIVRLNQSLAELAGAAPYAWRKLDKYLPPADADTGEDDPLPPDS